MKFNKQPVKNRHGMNMLVHFEPATTKTDKLVFIQHGYSGSMDEEHIYDFGQTFLKNGYNVVMMDSTNSFNDADGVIEDNTAQSHYEDLEDTIKWARTQDWFQEPFALAGHSLGGLSTLIYSENFPHSVSLLFPAAAVISGKLLEKAKKENEPDAYAELLATGKMSIDCSYKENTTGYRYHNWYETMYDWDALLKANKLNMPVLLIVGADDDATLPQDQKSLYDLIPSKKEIHIIKDTDHCYSDKIPEACAHLDAFLKKYA